MTERYSKANRELVDNWLTNHGYSTWTWLELPQILREALAKEGIVERKDDCNMVLIRRNPNSDDRSKDEYLMALKVVYENDKTQRHALWDAVVKLLNIRQTRRSQPGSN